MKNLDSEVFKNYKIKSKKKFEVIPTNLKEIKIAPNPHLAARLNIDENLVFIFPTQINDILNKNIIADYEKYSTDPIENLDKNMLYDMELTPDNFICVKPEFLEPVFILHYLNSLAIVDVETGTTICNFTNSPYTYFENGIKKVKSLKNVRISNLIGKLYEKFFIQTTKNFNSREKNRPDYAEFIDSKILDILCLYREKYKSNNPNIQFPLNVI